HQCTRDHPELPSFPTRRSSDLSEGLRRGPDGTRAVQRRDDPRRRRPGAHRGRREPPVTTSSDDVRNLSRAALDALRGVANIGAGHAATALSQITGQRIMISVPQINVTAIEDVPNQIGAAEEPVAAVAIRVEGDLTGLTLLVFPQPIAHRIASLMMGGRPVSQLGAIEDSALKE